MTSSTFHKNGRFLKWIKHLFILLSLFICAFGLSSCASAGKDYRTPEATFTNTYNSSNDTTTVVFHITIENKSILDIKNVSYQFDLYNGDTFVRQTKMLSFEISIGHGETISFDRLFSFDGNINKIRLANEDIVFKNLWETYMPWFIVVIAIVALFLIIYPIVIFVNNLDISDVLESISDNWWFIIILVVPYIPYVIQSFASGVWSWVTPLIILGGMISIIIIALFVHLIAFTIESISYSGTGDYYQEYTNNNSSVIDNYTSEEAALYQLTIPQLKEYCRNNGLTGYSSMTKDELVYLILNNQSQMDESGLENNSNKPIKKISKGHITFDDIAGLEEAKEAFREKVILPFEHPEIYEKFGKKAGGGILLYGLPGTGKTMFAEAASNEVNANFIPIKCSDIKSKWYGESEQKVKAIFSRARKSKRAIIFFDEFEAIGAKRTDDAYNGNNDLVPQILAEMQGIGSSSSESTIVVIAATNKPWSIDSAFMRPGRFDEKIYIPLPDKEARRRLFELQLSKLPVSNDLDYDYLVRITEGFNGADIKEVCEKLKMSAIKDSLEKGEEQTIGMDDVKRIENSIKSSVSREDIVQLELFESSSN